MPVITAAKKYLFIVVANIGDLIPLLHGNAESQSTEIISIEIKDTNRIRRDRDAQRAVIELLIFNRGNMSQR